MLEIKGKCNPVWEAFSLLMNLAEGTNPTDRVMELMDKYKIRDRSWSMKKKLLNSIYNEMLSTIQEQMEQVKFYFAPVEEDCNCIASLLVPIKILLLNRESADYISNWYHGMSKGEKESSFSEQLQNIKSKMMVENDENQPQREMELLREIIHADIQDASKIKMEELYLDMDFHFEQIMKLISQGIEVFTYHQKEVQQIEKDFTSYWADQSKIQSIMEYLKTSFGFSLMENTHREFVRPQFMQPGSIHMLTDDNVSDWGQWYLYIGILYGDELKPEVKTTMTQEELSSCLKLLSDKSKLEILQFIGDDWRYGSEIAKKLELTTATISYHMGALLSQGMVEIRKEENKIYYKENKKMIETIFENATKLLL